MCIGVLLAYLSVLCTCMVPMETRRGYHILGNGGIDGHMGAGN